MLLEIAIARAVADRGDPHGGQGAEAGGERDGEGGAGRGGQLHFGAARVDRLSCEQSGSGGGGNGKQAVLGLHCSAADVDGGRMDFGDVQEIEGDAGSHDIGDGIDRADFVKVNFFDGHAMDTGFGFAQSKEDGGRGGLRAWR